MKFFSSLILSLCSVLVFSQTILYQTETVSRTVQDPQTVVMAQGFHAKAGVSNSFVAKIGPATENSGGGPANSNAGESNPSGATAPDKQSFHDTKGKMEVNGGGQLQFTLPIALPPGIRTVAPQINLVYTSGAGNGIAGYGWNLTGITSISRMGRNIDKDKEAKEIMMDYSDYYSFNGQRLILKSGEYGKNGAEYVTEKYSNLKIKSLGSRNGIQGPMLFHVTFEDGSQAWYGDTVHDDPGHASAGRTSMEYNIVKWMDVQGNYITYEYEKNANITSQTTIAGEVSKIKLIKWGGNEKLSKPHFNEIQFNYNVERTVKELSYHQGYYYNQDKLLNEIVVKANSSAFKSYKIEYTNNNTSYQFVDTITEINANGESANPIKFDRKADSSTIKSSEISNNLNLDSKNIADFDGDGYLDLLTYQTSADGYYECVQYDDYGHCEREGDYIQPTVAGTYITYNNFFGAKKVRVSDINLTGALAINATLVNDKMRPVKSLYTHKAESNQIKFDKYVLENEQYVLNQSKTVPSSLYDKKYDSPSDNPQSDRITIRSYVREFRDIDANGDGLSEVLFSVENITTIYPYNGPIDDPEVIVGDPTVPIHRPVESYSSFDYYIVNPNTSQNDAYWVGSGVRDLLKEGIAMDFDGDGKENLVEVLKDWVSSNSFVINDAGKYVMKSNSVLYYGEKTGMVFGDFNGDGKMDFMVPQGTETSNWKLYMNSGKTPVSGNDNLSFTVQNFDNFSYYTKEPVLVDKTYNRTVAISHFAKDLNGDGKSDLIRFESQLFQAHKCCKDLDSRRGFKVLESAGVDINGNIKFETKYDEDPWSMISQIGAHWIPMNVSLRINKEENIFFVKVENHLFRYTYYDIKNRERIYAINQGGIKTEIVYNEIDANDATTAKFYKPTTIQTYPYVQVEHMPQSFIVTQLKEEGRKQDFKYRDLIVNLHGKGVMGYRQAARSTWYADGFENTKIWSGAEIDPLNEGVTLKEWSIKTNDENKIFPATISENNNELLNYKSINYQKDQLLNGQVITNTAGVDKSKIVTALLPKSTITKDFLTNTLTADSIVYGAYYLLAQTISNVNNDYAITTSSFDYNHNPTASGSDYFIGRLKSQTNTVQAYGDVKSAKVEYSYDGNLTKTVKTWNRDNSGYLLETYDYDGFGNVTKTVTSNSVDALTQTQIAKYDLKGRFVVKKTDNLGLETNIDYNDWGQIKLQTDPLGNTLENIYDGWGKLLKSKTNLGGTTTYQYLRDIDSNITLIQYDADGNISKKYTNKIGQEYKKATKSLGQGKYVTVYSVYDILGRKIRESEPYFEQASEEIPGDLQWNVNTYDDTVFPAKVTTTGLAKISTQGLITSFTGKKMESSVSGNITSVVEVNGYGRTTTKTTDALGNVISTSDKGGNISFSYNASGEQVKAQYAENIVTTKYDSWGRKSEFNDPSNGLYKYEYNGFGQPKKTISPKGTKEFVYNNLGQLISQKEISTVDNGQATDKTITYTYDNKGRVIAKNGTSKGKPYSSNISFDQQGRVLSSSESSNGKYFIQKGITYDDKGRVITYEKSLYSLGVFTKVNIENVYNDWNGTLSQIKDKNSGKVLWEIKDINARGQVLSSKLGAANITNAYDGNGFLMSVNHSSQVKSGILDLGYSFDGVKNELKSRRTSGDFNILESFNYDDNNRLVSWTDPVTGITPPNRNVYDAKGRIIQNDQVGTIKYENSSKIYQPTGMTLNAAGTQNYNNDLIQSITYNENNDPVFIDGEKGDVAFQYGLTSMRQKVTYGGNFDADKEGKFTKFYSEDGSFEIIKDNTSGKEKHVLYIGGSPYESNIVYIKNYEESGGSYKFLHKDYLSSILAISDEAGNKLEQRHFDAWGNFTHLQIGSGQIITDKNSINSTALLLERGYTSHEHFAEVGIIHMNGRLYDPLLRRFLNADENIPDPTNTQNYNKYGYVMNNPLMFNDPTGEEPFTLAAITVAALVKAVIIGAAVGLAAYTLSLAVTGNFDQWNLLGAFKATFTGAVSGAVTFGIGSLFTVAGQAATTLTALGNSIKEAVGGFGLAVVQAGTHAISQGILSVVQGDTFLSGAAGGFFGSLGAAAFGEIVKTGTPRVIGTLVLGSLSGGIGAEFAGGNFWQGAVIGGVVAGLNHLAHASYGPGDDPKSKNNVKKKAATTKNIQPLVKKAAQVATVIDVVGDMPGGGKLLKLTGKSAGKAFPVLETTSNVMEYSNGDISGQRLSYRSVGVGTSIVVGAEVGSIFPGYGSAAGAVVGGIFGTAELLYDQFNQYVKPVMQQKVNNFSNQLKFAR
ncbi:RHS repeat-associated core domain-containing protein [Chryseobacterium sp. WX]|uniref:RHS repeat-associated core domain-containing protein n=1 Tax=Chryseobacterium sp. WX TaxID=3031803 RepID=UPI0024092327|nr:RHS repeat-associated core domain-containing protein [Chryseobacterium sp. WX]WFB70004.1 RHS repeat-associated core domain-containing protein [Chryseobacterium sp. WX]